MNWTRPTFDTIKMDAEIGSYQEDRSDDPPSRPFASSLLGLVPSDPPQLGLLVAGTRPSVDGSFSSRQGSPRC